jgi:hypothetical protein
MLLAILAVVGAVVAWLIGGRGLTLAVDAVVLARVESRTATPIGWSGTALVIGPRSFGLEGPDFLPVARVRADPFGRLVLSAGTQTFIFGTRAGTVPDMLGDVPSFAAEPGDETSFTIERSRFGWPTPLGFSLGGRSPSWRRAIYYRLTWTKRNGARLAMLWRFEQWFFDDWGADMTRERWSGLVQVSIRPPDPVPARPQ